MPPLQGDGLERRAVLSAVGYSGTNATGVVVRDSVWDRNGQDPAQHLRERGAAARGAERPSSGTRSRRAAGRACRSTQRSPASRHRHRSGRRERERHHREPREPQRRYGIAVFPTARFVSFSPGPEPGPPWRPRGNRVRAKRRHRQRSSRPRARRRLRQRQLLHEERRRAGLSPAPADEELCRRLARRKRPGRGRAHATGPRDGSRDDRPAAPALHGDADAAAASEHAGVRGLEVSLPRRVGRLPDQPLGTKLARAAARARPSAS